MATKKTHRRNDCACHGCFFTVTGASMSRVLCPSTDLAYTRDRNPRGSRSDGAQNDFYRAAARRSDAASRKLLGDLAASEARKVRAEGLLKFNLLRGCSRRGFAKRQFIREQPGLAGLMDGSVSTLAPIFATLWSLPPRTRIPRFWQGWRLLAFAIGIVIGS